MGGERRKIEATVRACASGGGSASTGMEGAPLPSAGTLWRAWGAPIPSTADPGRAEQTRPRASRSFVQ